MNVNTVNPYLPHGVEHARQSAVMPKHLQVQDSYKGTAQGQAYWKTAQEALKTTEDQSAPQFVQQDRSHLIQTQQLPSQQTVRDPVQEALRASTNGSILNATRGMTMGAKDYPIILDGEVIIADGTVKPGYSRQVLI